MARTGRPTKLGDDVARELVELLAGGATITEAAATLGIDRTTLQDWRRRAYSTAPTDQPFVAMERRLRDALLETVRRHVPQRSWKDAAAQPEQLAPERWAPPPALEDLLGERP